MANTTQIGSKFISITMDGATDWDLTTNMVQRMTDGLFVKSISVYAASAAVIICRNVVAADQVAEKVFHFVASTGQLSFQYVFQGGCWMRPAFDATDCGAGTVVIEYE